MHCQGFINGLPVSGARLPAESEWEYACRAGTASLFSFGNSKDDLDRFGQVMKSSSAVVGLLEPNAWGLYDMHGNVSEWTLGRLVDYPSSATPGRVRDQRPVHRGGSFATPAKRATSAFRSAGRFEASTGFRVVARPTR